MFKIMPLQVLAFAMVVYSNDLAFKALGYFILGILHIKTNNCFTHIYELVDDEHRALQATIICILDESTLFWIGFILKHYVRDLEVVFKGYFIVGTVAVLLYFLIIPESPKWLFFVEGPDSKRAKDNLNLIAWMNGSRYRVPMCAKMDILGDAIIDNRS